MHERAKPFPPAGPSHLASLAPKVSYSGHHRKQEQVAVDADETEDQKNLRASLQENEAALRKIELSAYC